MTDLHEYAFGGKIYIDLREILPLRPYAKGCNSTGKLIQRKGFKDVINGRITDNVLHQTAKQSRKYGSIFVNKTEVLELFDTPPNTMPTAPPTIDMRLHMAQLDLNEIKCACELKLQMAKLEIGEMKLECDIRIHMMQLELDETKRACDVRIHMMRLELNEARREYNTKLYRADMDLISAQNTIDMLKMRIRIMDAQKNMPKF